MADFCIVCGAEADWVQSTQFAGDHHTASNMQMLNRIFKNQIPINIGIK